MGGKQRTSGKHLYLCLAGLIMLAAGCAHGLIHGTHRPVPEQPRLPQARWEHLQPVQARIDAGDFEGAIRDYQSMLSRSGQGTHADLMLFDLGLLYSHYDNPRKDYTRSLVYFSRIIKEHPRSPLLQEAKIWVNLLETMERTKRVDIELEEKMKAFNR